MLSSRHPRHRRLGHLASHTHTHIYPPRTPTRPVLPPPQPAAAKTLSRAFTTPPTAHLTPPTTARQTLERNPSAFRPKINHSAPGAANSDAVGRHNKGCHCKKSGCLKKYCECFERGVPCTPLCKCSNCKNPFQTLAGARPRGHDGESCCHHMGEDLAVEDVGEAASAILAAGPTTMAQDLEEPTDEEEMKRMEAHIINNNDESGETREMNKEIESHEEVACIDNIEIKLQRNLDEQQ